jgi:hypothetical protein
MRNLAFHRAAQDARQQWAGQQFWVTAHNNFLDTAVLEWCKVFGDLKAKHAWRKSVTDEQAFMDALMERLRLTPGMFDDYIREMRTYRDRFLAHLDEDERMQIPNLVAATRSAQFLYQYLLDREDDCDAFPDAPRIAVAYFQGFVAEAHEVYRARMLPVG